VGQALLAGQLDPPAAEITARKLKSHSAQNQWLAKELERRARKAEGQHLAAMVINDLLGAGVFDLSRIGTAIREAISEA
jgi:hypothetical protein